VHKVVFDVGLAEDTLDLRNGLKLLAGLGQAVHQIRCGALTSHLREGALEHIFDTQVLDEIR